MGSSFRKSLQSSYLFISEEGVWHVNDVIWHAHGLKVKGACLSISSLGPSSPGSNPPRVFFSFFFFSKYTDLDKIQLSKGRQK